MSKGNGGPTPKKGKRMRYLPPDGGVGAGAVFGKAAPLGPVEAAQTVAARQAEVCTCKNGARSGGTVLVHGVWVGKGSFRFI